MQYHYRNALAIFLANFNVTACVGFKTDNCIHSQHVVSNFRCIRIMCVLGLQSHYNLDGFVRINKYLSIIIVAIL